MFEKNENKAKNARDCPFKKIKEWERQKYKERIKDKQFEREKIEEGERNDVSRAGFELRTADIGFASPPATPKPEYKQKVVPT